MRRLTIALLAACLLGTSAIPAIAQDQSPPPWLGGRVKMPEYGFAVTLSNDWVAFDTTVDVTNQLEAASDFFDPAIWTDVLDLAGAASQVVMLWLVRARGFSLAARRMLLVMGGAPGPRPSRTRGSRHLAIVQGAPRSACDHPPRSCLGRHAVYTSVLVAPSWDAVDER